MQVNKKENTEGTLLEIEFINTGDENFKAEVKKWLRANLPGMTYENFFDKLEEYRSSACRINMHG